MPTVRLTLGQDAADAVLNRPVVILRPAEVAALLALPAVSSGEARRLAAILAGDGPFPRALGAGQLSGLRLELRRLLEAIGAPQLPGQLPLAIALQRLDTACATAQEFGLNLYPAVDDD